jgi:glycosyltransferase involved in cell wall biosynthesis
MPLSLVIDLRCLQDRNYYERGIGSHARMILRHAPEFVGLVDPELPKLPDEVAALVPEISPHADVKGASMLLNPSPFSPNQAFLARLLTDERVLKAVCVHDFIPFDDQANYLTHPINRLDYFTAMAWLRRYDFFLPNSVPTETRLHELYGKVRSTVTGVALPPWVYGITPGVARHILMIGGDDARKNPEVLAAAHASSPVLRRLPLVITGHVPAERAARLRALTNVELPGRLSAPAMRELYAQALVVVTPSLAEGFSLPVLEACAAGVPSIASDIPAHRALLPEEFLFGADDAAGLARLLEEILLRREEVVRAQAGLWQSFAEETVAAKIFGALLPKPAVARGAKPHIAVLSPMPPEKSGIADYSAAMVRELRKRADVLVLDSNAQSPLPYMDARYDAVLGVVGNAPLHERVHDFALRWGGAVLCHDARLQGMFSARGNAAVARMAGEELGRVVAEDEILAWAVDERLREACFLGPLARTARPLIFHARPCVDLVRERFGVGAEYLPFAMQREFAPVDRGAARAALGIGADERLIVSFGFLTPGKGIEAALAAFALLRGAKYRLVFVGEATGYVESLKLLARDLGIAARVTLGTGFVDEQTYRLWLAAADAGLQLRAGRPGAISGTLQDCIGAGLPCVANADLATNLQAPGYVTRVGDVLDAREIAAALEAALETWGDTGAECAAYKAGHSMAGYAEALLRLLGI